MKCYLKVKDHLYYQIEKGNIISINTDTQSIKRKKCLPTTYAEDFEVISEEEYNQAKKQLKL